jgi:hypothetical protein
VGLVVKVINAETFSVSQNSRGDGKYWKPIKTGKPLSYPPL